MSLIEDLDALRRRPGADLQTLALVRDVFAKNAGERLTVAKGQSRAQRLTQARAVVGAGTSRADAVRHIMAALGTSRSTAYRYVGRLSAAMPNKSKPVNELTGRQIARLTQSTKA